MFDNILPKIVPFIRQCGENGRVRQASSGSIIRRLLIACWVIKATDTQYVILIAVPRQPW